MNKIYYHTDNPDLIYTTIDIEEHIRQRMIECVLSQKELANYHGGYTFEVLDPYHDFADLYDRFLKIAEHVFGPFRFSVKHKHWCWANVYNREKNQTNMHDHHNTSTINAVYYLNIPSNMEEQGRLEIYNQGRVDAFYPETGDLVIMPSWLPHRPCDHDSNEFRIAINMEISTIEDIDQLYTLDKIMMRCDNGRSL